MAEPIADLENKAANALNNPLVRVGTVHEIKKSRLYKDEKPGGHPFLTITFTWVEPEDPPENAQIVAMELHVPQELIFMLDKQLSKLRATDNGTR